MLEVPSDPIVKVSVSLRRSQIDGLQAVANAEGHRKRSRVAQRYIEAGLRTKGGINWRRNLAKILEGDAEFYRDEQEADVA